MKKFYRNLSKKKKIVFLITTTLLASPLGGAIGFVLGLVAITFVPSCCNDNGCHSCAQFNGMIGYEATATIGFWIGLFLLPIVYLAIVIDFNRKSNMKK